MLYIKGDAPVSKNLEFELRKAPGGVIRLYVNFVGGEAKDAEHLIEIDPEKKIFASRGVSSKWGFPIKNGFTTQISER